MAKRISIIVPLLVITLCCLALVEGGYTALEYLLLRPKVSMSAPASEDGLALKVRKVAIDRKNGSQIIVARNLFSASGNEVGHLGASANTLDALEATSLGIVLMGTIEDSSGGNRAIILDKKTLEQQIYRQGETVQEAVIKEILRGKAILSVHGQDEILDMSEAAKLRPVQQNATADNQAQAAPQDTAPAVFENNTLEQQAAGAPPQYGSPISPIGAEQSAKTVILPPIHRPVRASANN